MKRSMGITRADVAYMTAKAAKATPSRAAGLRFKDRLPVWAKDAITWASEKNILSGYPGGYFKPAKAASRAEICVILQKALTVAGLKFTARIAE